MNTFLIVFLITSPFLFTAAFAGISAAPWLPTKRGDREHMLSKLQINQGMKIIDLGSGDGSVLFALARQHKNATFIGYEISLLPLLVSVLRKYFGGYKNVSFKCQNLFRANLDGVDIVFVFLLDKSYPKLAKKFTAELSDSSRVIVEAWPIEAIEPKKVFKEKKRLPIFVYEGKAFRRK
ncbi:MAG: hypothetical protein O3B64_02890 [bacterium]|nr:hypothetical protein [bacterium]MDA1024386.1 hypothetical protein [bacterium]